MSTDYSDGNFSQAEPRWRVTSLFELRQGIDVFGASRFCGSSGSDCDVPPSRAEGRATATVLRSTTFGEFRPVKKVTFSLGLLTQYAWKPLLSFEEFSAGNYTVGRGYDPGALLGDKGFGTQAELRFGSRVPQSVRSPAIEGYAFWDHAEVRNRDRLTDPVGRQHLDSVGAGARINFDRFALDAALAVPLTRIGIDDRRPATRFLVSLTSRLWPWSYR
jgi:hemolysin activation/secretion protein